MPRLRKLSAMEAAFLATFAISVRNESVAASLNAAAFEAI